MYRLFSENSIKTLSAFTIAAFTAFFLLILPFPAQTADIQPLPDGPTSKSDYPEIEIDDALRLEILRMQIMTHNEHGLARHERIAHDYVYAESLYGYDDERLQRRMKADGLTLVETFRDADGTAAMVVRDDNTGKYTIAFRGTDDQVMENLANLGETFSDKPVGHAQYNKHAAIWDEWARKYGGDGNLTVTGHSRGGGLAALFTATHADKIEELAMFQSPGQTFEDYKNFHEAAAGKWPKTTLIVAAKDLVQLSGQRHIGNPQVIVALANDMDLNLSRIGGHKNYVLQNPWITDWHDKLYRNANDELLRAVMDYHAYAALRVWASPNTPKAQSEIDVWTDWFREFRDPLNGNTIDALFVVAEGMTLLDYAEDGFQRLKQEILRQNREVLADKGLGEPRPPADLFDHLLPAQFYYFEDDFFRVFEELIEHDFQEMEARTRTKSAFALDAGVRALIREIGIRAYLEALKSNYEGGPIDLDNEGGAAIWVGKQPDRDERVALVQKYYELQKEALIVFSDMFEAGAKLVGAKIEEAAISVAEIVGSIEDFLLNAATRQAVTTKAQNPPRPAGSGGVAQAQAVAQVQQVQQTGAANAAWYPISRAYEEIHEDLFAGAITFGQYQNEVRAWQAVSLGFWDAVFSWIPNSDIQGRNRANAERVKFNTEIAAIDASFAFQAANKLAKLDLLYSRYRDADAPELLAELESEVKQAEATLAGISAGAPGWFEPDGTAKGAGAGFLAGLTPAGAGPAMAFLSDTTRLGDEVAQETLAQFDIMTDIIDAAIPKVAREQDYVLGVLDFYMLEMQREREIITFSAAKGQGRYPHGSELLSQAYNTWLNPLSDVMARLLEIKAMLDQNGRNAQDFGRIAEESAAEIAYYGKAFQTLLDEEERLFSDYQAIVIALHQGSSDAQTRIKTDDWGLTPLTNFEGPLLTLNDLVLCVELFNCDGPHNTGEYIAKISDRLRVWRLPPGDTREAQPSSEVALGPLWAYVPEHQLLASQFAVAQQEVQGQVDQITPLHQRYLALVEWRKGLEATFRAQVAEKPVLSRAMAGNGAYTRWDGVTPQYQSFDNWQGNLPQAYALSPEMSRTWWELHFDFTHLTGRLAYLQGEFIPTATRLIADISDIEARLHGDVEWRVAEIRRLTDEIKANPNMPPLIRAEKLDLANKYVNFALGTHHSVVDYAPFRADFATEAQAAYLELEQVAVPPPEVGSVTGRVSTASGTPLAGMTVRLNKLVNSGVGPSATIMTDAGGGFVVAGLATGWWQVTIASPGYQPFAENVFIQAFAPSEVIAILAPLSGAGDGNLRLVIERAPGTPDTALEVRITDQRGNMVAQGLGPHDLTPGQYILNTYAQYLETDPSSHHFQIFQGDRITLKISVWLDDEEEDDPPVSPPQPPPPPGGPDFSDAVIALCAPNPDFVRSLYHTILERDPEDWEIQTFVGQLEVGDTRSLLVRGFLLDVEYASLGKQGAAFITDVIQATLGRAPTVQELSSWPRSHAATIIDDYLASPEHLSATDACAPLWREGIPEEGVLVPDPGTTLTEQQAYEAYIAAYNKLTSLMAAGQGDTPAAQVAYDAYILAKEIYEAILAGEKPPSGGTNVPTGGTGSGADPGTNTGIVKGGNKDTGAGSNGAISPPTDPTDPIDPITRIHGGEIVSDSSWWVTADFPNTLAWQASGFDNAGWQNAIADWPAQPTLATNITNMNDTAASWIWMQGDPEMVLFRRSFTLPDLPANATLRITADNNYSVYINAEYIGTDWGDAVTVWNTAESFEITSYLQKGENVVAIVANDLGGGSGLLADIRFDGVTALPVGDPPPAVHTPPVIATPPTLDFGSDLGPKPFTTPARGTPERSAIMDAARIPVSADIGQSVIFVVDRLRSNGLWAYLQATPHQPDGAPLNWSQTNFAEDWQGDMMSDVVMVLLNNSGGTWQVADYVIGPTDVYWYVWVDHFGLPESLFFAQ